MKSCASSADTYGVRSPAPTLITRQPVYDAGGGVFGFALIGSPAADGPGAGDAARSTDSARTLVQGVLSGALDGLTRGHKVIVEVSADLLLEGLDGLIRGGEAVIKLPPGTSDSRELASLLDRLRATGTMVVLSRYRHRDDRRDLLPHVDAVSIDLSAPELSPHPGEVRLPLLGENIDDLERFHRARDLGCSWYEGAAFIGSAVIERSGPVGFRPVHLAVLKAVQRPDVDYAELERLVKQDIQLTHAFLRYVNSAYFGWRGRLESLRHAFVLLGEHAVRSWATLVVMADLAADQPQQLAVTAALRARFCELLGRESRVAAQPLELFTLGMFSLIDVLSGRSMREVLAELPLSPDVQGALLGEENPLRLVLDAVIAYEEADWPALAVAVERLGADDERLLELYLAAVDWAAGTFDRALDVSAGQELPVY